MVDRIVEIRPDTFRACAACPYADKATERAKLGVIDRRGEEQIETATITIKCEGGNLSKGILGVHADIDGKLKSGGGFRTYIHGENVECPGLKEEWTTLGLSQSEKP